jgi:hypothetical protein
MEIAVYTGITAQAKKADMLLARKDQRGGDILIWRRMATFPRHLLYNLFWQCHPILRLSVMGGGA